MKFRSLILELDSVSKRYFFWMKVITEIINKKATFTWENINNFYEWIREFDENDISNAEVIG